MGAVNCYCRRGRRASQAIKGLRQGRLHASFDRIIPVLSDLQRECVMRERIGVALNRKNPPSARSEGDFLALRDKPMIVGDLPNSSLVPAYILPRHYSFEFSWWLTKPPISSPQFASWREVSELAWNRT